MSDAPVASGETAEAAAVPDRELLAAFVFRRDERAFERIVRRHGAMVYGVCRRVLRDAHACDDAFQATFLVLAKSAGRIRKRQSLASWLHGVAHRVARRALVERYRRHEQAAVMEQVIGEPELRDVEARHQQQLLDSELQALPERYREPLVLHYLEGLSNRELAERLGLSVAAVEGRLKRARKELRLRLTRHGVELSAIVVLLHAAQPAAAGALLESLITVAAKSGAAAAAGTLSTHVTTSQAAALAGKELAMLTFSTKMTVLLATSVAAVSLLAFHTGNATRAGHFSSEASAVSVATFAESNDEPAVDAEDALDPRVSSVSAVSSGEVDGAGETTGDLRSLDELARRIRTALRSPTSLSFADTPLRDAIDQIASEHRIPISMDGDELARHGITGDENISLEVDEKSLQSALREMLRDVNGVPLAYVLDDLSILITSQTKAEQVAGAEQPPDQYTYRMSEANVRRIEAALESETTIEFPGNPLRDVTEYLSQIHNMPILIDETALADVGISSDEEVSLVISDITLRSAMELLLENVAGVELDYVIRDEVLKITTREKADEMLETRVYNVRDFGSEFDEVMLANVVRKSVQPRSWMNITIESVEAAPGMEGSAGMMPGLPGGEVGGMDPYSGLGPASSEITGMTIHADSDGNGTIDFLPGCLIITQSQRIHREIVSLLDQLRQHAASQPAASPYPEPATYVDEVNAGSGYFPGSLGTPSPGR